MNPLVWLSPNLKLLLQCCQRQQIIRILLQYFQQWKAHSESWFTHNCCYDSLGEVNQQSLIAPSEEYTSHALMRCAAIATISVFYLRDFFITILNNRCCLSWINYKFPPRGGNYRAKKTMIIIKPWFFNWYEETERQNLLLSCDWFGNGMVLTTAYGCNESCKHALL